MNTEQAFKLGVAYRLGMLYANFLTCDSNTNNPYWVTIKNGIHLLIEENGNILNGHFKGQNIDHIYKNKTINEKKVKQRKSQTTPRAEIYNNYGDECKTALKGSDAIKLLLSKKSGYLKAFFKDPVLGNIDLAYGTDTFGLKHFIKNRTDNGYSVDEIIKQMNNCMTQGKLYKDIDGSYLKTNYPQGNFGVVILKNFKGNKVNSILTVRPIKGKNLKKCKKVKE